MASTRPFGQLNSTKPKLVEPPQPTGDGQIPIDLDTDRRKNQNPKTQSVKLGALARRKTSSYA